MPIVAVGGHKKCLYWTSLFPFTVLKSTLLAMGEGEGLNCADHCVW